MAMKFISHFFTLLLIASYNNCTFSQDAAKVFECGMTITDPRDGKEYKTVQIGSQCWMAENLNIGIRISSIKDQRDNGIIEKYCYDNKEENCDIYGGLYQWDELIQHAAGNTKQDICPPGWHVSSDEEWCILTFFIDTTVQCDIVGPSGTDASAHLKATGTQKENKGPWLNTDNGATNRNGFNALPAGTRTILAKSYYLGYHACFWTSTTFNENDAWFRYFKYSNSSVYREHYLKTTGYSVRCILDHSTY